MSGQEFVLAVVAIGSGSLVLIVGITSITGLIKSWLKCGRKSEFSDEQFRKLTKTFTQHKKDMERRLQNIETITADEAPSSSQKPLGQSHQDIEIKEVDEKNTTNAKKNNLKNMLRE